MAKTTKKKPILKAGTDVRTLKGESHEQEMVETTKSDVIEKLEAEVNRMLAELREEEMSPTNKEEKWDAVLAKMALIERERIIRYRTATPKFNPAAWRHRVLSEVGRMGGKASAKSLTPQQRTERARKAGKARQAQAKEAAKKGGSK